MRPLNWLRWGDAHAGLPLGSQCGMMSTRRWCSLLVGPGLVSSRRCMMLFLIVFLSPRDVREEGLRLVSAQLGSLAFCLVGVHSLLELIGAGLCFSNACWLHPFHRYSYAPTVGNPLVAHCLCRGLCPPRYLVLAGLRCLLSLGRSFAFEATATLDRLSPLEMREFNAWTFSLLAVFGRLVCCCNLAVSSPC
eukprot:s890_g7.t1